MYWFAPNKAPYKPYPALLSVATPTAWEAILFLQHHTAFPVSQGALCIRLPQKEIKKQWLLSGSNLKGYRTNILLGNVWVVILKGYQGKCLNVCFVTIHLNSGLLLLTFNCCIIFTTDKIRSFHSAFWKGSFQGCPTVPFEKRNLVQKYSEFLTFCQKEYMFDFIKTMFPLKRLQLKLDFTSISLHHKHFATPAITSAKYVYVTNKMLFDYNKCLLNAK